MTRRGAELRRSVRYRLARDDLSLRLQRLVRWTEDDIAEEPDHNFWRRRLDDGRVCDYSLADQGLLIFFRVVSPDVVELDQLVDTRPGH
jgi:hypothetical protein